MSLIIRLRDNFEWEAYEKAVQKLMNYKKPVIVTWDLTSLTKIQWEHVAKTLKLLGKISHLPQEHIVKSIILLPSKEWKNCLNIVFRLSPPQTPVELFIEGAEKTREVRRGKPKFS